MVKIDYVSDLHIDHWDERYRPFYPLGERKNFPLNWEKMKQSDILVIAGDISDNLFTSLEYLNQLKKLYKHIVFIDGNHEHIPVYPRLYPYEQIIEKVKHDKQLHYLPHKDFIIDGVAFVGFCGWWDYSAAENIEKHSNYFQGWIQRLDEIETRKFSDFVCIRAMSEFTKLFKRLNKLEEDNAVDKIVIVTHTVPRKTLSRDPDTDFNSNMWTINQHQFKKLSTWIFGHTHSGCHINLDGVLYASNPRGRPEDYDREEYKARSLVIE